MQFSNYTIEKQIGEGGMASVFLAKHNILQKPVAVKVLKEEFLRNENIRKRFLSESRNMFEMSHPNIIRVTDLIDQEGLVAFVMEYVDGITLKEHIEQKGALAPTEIKKLFSQMLDAVGYVHEKGFVHRDIKPSNFMLDKKGNVKLLDFGIAKNTDTAASDYTMTGTLQNMGTPMYMSPEQVKSTKDVAKQSDIYSLGVVLWQMIKGQKPYDANTLSIFDIQMKIVGEQLSLTGTPFDQAIKKATEKDPSSRYENCREFSFSLSNLDGIQVADKKAAPPPAAEATTIQSSTPPLPRVAPTDASKPPLAPPTPTTAKATPPTSPKKSRPYILPIIIGTIILIAVGLRLRSEDSNNNTDGDDYYYNSERIIDSEEIVGDSYLPVDTTTRESLPTIYFTNSTNNRILIALAYDNSGFETRGWFAVEANSDIAIPLPHRIGDEIFWYAMQEDDNEEYSGSDGYFCLDTQKKFHYIEPGKADGCDNPVGFTRMWISNGYGSHHF
jgi:serine/threonine protein kinase